MRSTIFRIFLSSTFGDFQAEREALRATVWPRLESYCAARGASFEVVDLRWGVSEADSLSHDTLRICLDEIAHCQKLSPKPNFLMLIGDRYGWRPLPTEIPAEEFEAILAILATDDERCDLLNRWYCCDDNALPPHYRLQPRVTAQQSAWADTEDKLVSLLRDATRLLGLTPELRERYFLSATHLEIVQGALAVPDADAHVFAFFRDIHGLVAAGTAAARFTDLIGGQPDAEAARLCAELRSEIAVTIPADHCFAYVCQWKGQSDTPITTDHLATLCADIERSLQDQIDRELHAIIGDALDREIALHKAFADEKVATFMVREAELEQGIAWADAALTTEEAAPPLIVLGPGGVGKSAFMAKVTADIAARHPEAVVIRRFIGTAPRSIDLYVFLGDLLREIARHYDQPEALPEGSLKVLIDELPVRLAWASDENPLVLALDALDQFNPSFEACHHHWLPRQFPAYVAVLCSVLDGEVKDAAAQRFPEASLLPLPVFSHEEGGRLLDALLRTGEDIAPQRQRRLTAGQRQAVLDAFDCDGRPLYLVLAASIVRRWISWQDAETLPGSIETLVADIIRRLHARHGERIADRALDYLTASRFGVSDEEMRDLLWQDVEARAEFDLRKNKDQPDVSALPPVIWSRIYFELAPYLKEQGIDGALLHRFFHRIIGDEVARATLADDKALVHASIADYFSRQPLYLGEGANRSPNRRKLMEEPWQRLQAGQLEQAEALLIDFDFAMAKCEANRFEDLFTDFQQLVLSLRLSGSTLSQNLIIWEEFIRTKAHILRRGDDAWPSHKILLQLAMEHADDSPLTLEAERFIKESKCNWAWLKNTHRPGKYYPSQCIAVLEGHSTSVDDVYAFDDGRVLSLSRDGTLRLWDSETGKTFAVLEDEAIISEGHYVLGDDCVLARNAKGELQVLNGGAGNLLTKRALDTTGRQDLADGRVLSWDGTSLRLFNGNSGRTLIEFAGHIGNIRGAQLLSDGRVLSWSDDGTLRLWNGDTGTPLALMEGHTHRINGVHVFSNGRMLSWSMDRTLRLWESENRETYALAAGATWNLGETIYSHDRMYLHSSQDETRCLWDGKTSKIFAVPAGHSSLFRTAWVLADNQVLSLLSDGTLLIGNGNTENDFAQFAGEHGSILDVHVMGDGRFVTHSSAAKLCLWGSKPIRPLALLEGHADQLGDIHILPSGDLVSCYPNGILRFWNSDSGVQLAELNGHSDCVNGIQILSDGRRLITWSDDTTIRIWDLFSWTTLAVLNGHSDAVIGVRELDDGRLMSWSEDAALRLWDGVNGQSLAVLVGHDGGITGADALSDGLLLSWSEEDDTIRLWDSVTGVTIALLECPTGVDGVDVLNSNRFLSWSGGPMQFRPEGDAILWSSSGERVGWLSTTRDDVFATVQDTKIIAPKLRGASDGIRVAWPKAWGLIWMDTSNSLTAKLFWHGDPREVNGILSIGVDQCLIQKGRRFTRLQTV
jgi:WD40 repeat protein